MINITQLNNPPASIAQQVVTSSLNNSYSLSKYIGIDANGNITNETKTTSDPVQLIETAALSNVVTTNPISVVCIDTSNNIAMRTSINLNALNSVYPYCSFANAVGTNYSLSITSTLQAITGPTQTGVTQDFIAYTNGVVGYNTSTQYNFLIQASISCSVANAGQCIFEIYKNSVGSGIRAQVNLAHSNVGSFITLVGILPLQQNDLLAIYASSNVSSTLTVPILRWVITKI